MNLKYPTYGGGKEVKRTNKENLFMDEQGRKEHGSECRC